MTTIPEELRARVAAYADDDPDARDADALRDQLASEDLAGLEAAFAGELAFGTAGLRATVGPGPARMNLRNVARATRALLESLTHHVERARERGLVVGFDARPSSERLASAVIAAAAADGFLVHAFDVPVPTPWVAFAANELGTAAAVVITASHNPPDDNGMKVFGPDASQIVPPFDAEVAARMHDARPTPKPPAREALDASARARIRTLDGTLGASHLGRCVALGSRTAPRAPIRVAYTALHGIGGAPVTAALAELGGIELHSVPEQFAPDGTFPTTRKPNPEEPEALGRVLALGDAVDADLVLATDPDADRLAVAVRDGASRVVLHGDELGVLLGTHLAGLGDVPRPAVLTTVVSSPWLLEIAADLGLRAERTLTGHKWLAARARTLASEGFRTVFAYEEAIGYAFDTGVRDKDGIAAAVLTARLASELAAVGQTPIDRLEAIARRHGMHRSRLGTLTLAGADAASRMAQRIDALRAHAPTSIAGRRVRAVLDGRRGIPRTLDGTGDALPPSSLLGFELEGGVRWLLRPSGTEPKLKLYLDLARTLGPEESYLGARREADRELDGILDAARAMLTDAP